MRASFRVLGELCRARVEELTPVPSELAAPAASRWRRRVARALPLVGALVVASIWFVRFRIPAELARAEADAITRLDAGAQARSAAVNLWLRQESAAVRTVAEFPATLELVNRTATRSAAAHLSPILDLVAREQALIRLAIVDGDGRVLAESREPNAPADPSLTLRDGLGSSREPKSVEFLAASGGSRAVIRIRIPIPVARGGAPAQAIGDLDPTDWLFPFLAASSSEMGESFVVERRGREIRFLSPSRVERGAAPGVFSVAFDRGGSPAAAAARGQSLSGRFVDVRGVEVLAAVRPLEVADWGLVVKSDRDQELAASRRELVTEGTFGGAAAAAMFLAIAALGAALRRQSELDRARDQQRIAAMLDQANDGILFFDADWRITDLNRRAETLYGWPQRELRGRHVASLRPPELRADLDAALAQLTKEGHLLIQTAHQRADGSRFPVEISTRRVESSASDTVYVAIVRDLSEARRAEERYASLFDAFPLPTWVYDVETLRFLAVNQAAVNQYGWSRKEMLDMTIRELRSPDEMAIFDEEMTRVREGVSGTRVREHVHRRKDGSLLEVLVFGQEQPFGDFRSRLIVARDVTELNRTQRELRKFSQAIEQSHAAVVFTDTTGAIEYVNPSFERNSGYSAAEAQGRNPRFLRSGITPAETYREMWSALTAGREWQGELCNRRKDGSLYWELASISPLVDAEGRTTHYVAVKEDITAIRRLEEELRRSQKLEALGRLAGGVAHDFNNLLTAIDGFTEIVLDDLGPDAPQRAELLEVRAAAKSAEALTRQLLAFSRRSPGQTHPVALGDMIVKLSKLLRRLVGEDVIITTELASDLGAVLADPASIEQVLVNLAVNARDAMPHGGTLRIRGTRETIDESAAALLGLRKAGDYARLSVADSGSGISPEVRERLFEPFFTTKEQGKGTGLGLATVYGIVERAGGRIDVESVPGEGATFHILWPRLAAESVVLLPDSSAVAGVGTETILLVEDDRALRAVAETMLTRAGYRVLAVEGGAEALRRIDETREPVDLLITDLRMPGLSGAEVVARIRAKGHTIRVLFTSGYAEGEVIDDADRRHRFLPKPFDSKTLLAKVREMLDEPPEDRASD